MFTNNNTSLLETVEYTIQTLDNNNGVYTVNKVPSKEGFEFLGWVVSSDDTPRKSFTFGYNELGDKHYYAKWNANVTYTITLENINLDYVTYDGKDYPVEGNNETSITINYDGDDTVEIKEPTRIGHTFNGWYDEDNNPMGKSFTLEAGTIGDKVYSASWKAIKYTITYNGLEGATNHQSNVNEYYITDTPITLYAPSKPHYDFNGWTGTNVVKDQTNGTYYIEKGTTGPVTVEANWLYHEYKITYNDGVNATNKFYTLEDVESGYDVYSYTPNSKTGYIFEGWIKEGETEVSKTIIITINDIGDKTYTAKWTPIPYTITYELNGGEVSGNPKTYTIETATFSLKTPTKEGFEFVGWTGSNGETASKEVTIVQGSTGDLSYTANWITNVTYTITLENINLDYVTYDGKDYPVEGNNETSITINYDGDDTVEIKEPTRIGHTFNGWYDEDNNPMGKSFTLEAGTIGDKVYSASWKAIKYTITYNGLEGATNHQSNVNEYYITDTPITLYAPSKPHYDFGGWKVANNSTVTSIAKGTTGNITLTATWAEKTYSIKYENLLNATFENGETNPTSYKITTKNLSLYNPARVGYDFTGWTSEQLTYDSNTKLFTIKQESYGKEIVIKANWEAITYNITYELGTNGVNNGNNPNSYTIESSFTLQTPTRSGYTFVRWEKDGNAVTGISAGNIGEVTFTAIWTANPYNIEYVLNGGTNAENTPTIYTPDEDTVIPNPTKNGYTFEGWTVKDSLGNEIAELTGKYITIYKDTISKDLTFTANWSDPISYSISYTLNGGTVSGNPTTYTVETASFTLNNPVLAGYDFVGWSGSELSGTDNKNVTIPSGSTGNRSYTAHFEPTNYSITYNLDGGTNNSSNPESYTIEDGDITLLAPTRTGYTFLGWTGSNGNTPTIDVTISSGSVGNKTYTANWQKGSYTITFDSNGSDETFDPISGEYNVEITKPEYYPQLDGKIFDGWYFNDTLFVFDKMPGENITLVARWLDLPEQTYNYLIPAEASFDSTASSIVKSLEQTYKDVTLFYNGATTYDYSDGHAYILTVEIKTNASDTVVMLTGYEIGFLVVAPKATSDYDVVVDTTNKTITIDLKVPNNSSATLFTSVNNYTNSSFNTFVNESETAVISVSDNLYKRSFGIFASGTQTWTFYTDRLGSLLPANSSGDSSIPPDESLLWDDSSSAQENNISFVSKLDSKLSFDVTIYVRQDKDTIDSANLALFNSKAGIACSNGDLKYTVVRGTEYHTIHVQILNTKAPSWTNWFETGGMIALRIGGAGLKTMMVGHSSSVMEQFIASTNKSSVSSAIPSDLYCEINSTGMKKIGYYSSSNTETGDMVTIYNYFSSAIDSLGLGLGYTSNWVDLHNKGGYVIYNCIDHTTGIRYKSDMYYLYFTKNAYSG